MSSIIYIRSVGDLLAQLSRDQIVPEMFRGQAEDWPLLPAIGRYPNIVHEHQNWRIFHEHVVSRFTRLARPYFESGFRSQADAWVHAQHYGLPTRLLDWSTNALKALFFAVSDPARDRFDGVLWGLSFEFWREELDHEMPQLWEDELWPFLPEQLNPRLIAQEGCFLSYPLPENQDPLQPVDQLIGDYRGLDLSKFVVPSDAKAPLRRELAAFGMKYRLLFPDPTGVARGITVEELET